MDAEYQKLISTPRRARLFQEMTPRLREFITEHQLAEPKAVLYQPLGFCAPKRCFVNVDQQVSKMGGSAITGWLFWEIENTVLETEAHCIWMSDQGSWIDITPQHPAPRRLLFSPDARVAQKRGYTVCYETVLTNNPKVLALQKFTRAISQLRQQYMQGFGREMLIPMERFWEAGRTAGLPEDVAEFLLEKMLSWDRAVTQKHGAKAH